MKVLISISLLPIFIGIICAISVEATPTKSNEIEQQEPKMPIIMVKSREIPFPANMEVTTSTTEPAGVLPSMPSSIDPLNEERPKRHIAFEFGVPNSYGYQAYTYPLFGDYTYYGNNYGYQDDGGYHHHHHHRHRHHSHRSHHHYDK